MFGPLSELFVDGCDDEQVWEEIQLTNTPFFECLKHRVRKMAAWRVHLCEASPDNERDDTDDDSGDTFEGETLADRRGSKMVQFAEDVEEDGEDDASDLEGSYHDDEGESPLQGSAMATKQRGSIVDDRFFKLSEMQQFLGEWCLHKCGPSP